MTEFEGARHDAAFLLSYSRTWWPFGGRSLRIAHAYFHREALKAKVRLMFEELNQAGIVFNPGIGRVLVLGPTRMRVVATRFRQDSDFGVFAIDARP